MTASLTPGQELGLAEVAAHHLQRLLLGYIDSRTPLSNAVLSWGTLARRRTSTPVMSALVTRRCGRCVFGCPAAATVPSVNAPLIAGTGVIFSPAALTFASLPLPSRPGLRAAAAPASSRSSEPSGKRRPTCALKVTGLPFTVVYTYSWSGGSTCCGKLLAERGLSTADSASGIGSARRGRAGSSGSFGRRRACCA